MAEVNSRNFEVTISSEGVAGPAGPVGPIGPQGVKGDKGDVGGFSASNNITVADMNDLTTPGLYYRGSSLTPPLNWPDEIFAGHVEVIAYPTGTWPKGVMQRATSVRTTPGPTGSFRRVYVRTQFNVEDWGPWMQMLTEDHVAASNPHPQYLRDADTPVITTNLVHMSLSGWATNSATHSAQTSRSLTVIVNGNPSAGILATAPNNRVEVVPGQTFTVSAFMTVSVSTPYSIILDFFDAAGARVQLTSAVPVLAANTKTAVTHTYTAPNNSKYLYAKFYSAGANLPAGTTIKIEDVVLTEGTKPWTYFDGSMPGHRWTGTPFESTSEKTLITADDWLQNTTLAEVRSDHMYYRGTGSPEGTVAAPVGSRYVDKNATNGAIEWVKASGTGTTGWKVANGDTGWRIIAQWNSQNQIIAGELNTGWGPMPTTEGSLRIRRADNIVEVSVTFVQATVTSPLAMTTLPVGFRPGIAQRVVSDKWNTSGVGNGTTTGFGIEGTGYFGRGGNSSIMAGDYYVGISHTFTTRDPWPTTLPGVVG